MTKGEEQTVLGEASPGNDQVCYDARTVAYDAGSVEYDAGSVNYDANSVEDDLGSLRGGFEQVQQDFATLRADQAKAPSFLPPGLPNQAAVNTAISSANGAISSAISTTNGYIAQVNGYVGTAYEYAAQAFQAGGWVSDQLRQVPSHISADAFDQGQLSCRGQSDDVPCS
jgi:hypothetical protein